MDSYTFNSERAYNEIKAHWEKWAKSVNAKGWIVGISGGKDSTVVAALAVKIFGEDNVFGVLMPNKEQKDIADSEEVCHILGIKYAQVNIGKAYEELMDEVVFGALRPYGIKRASNDTITNMPARLRMTALYAVAQSLGYMVLNTCNASENCAGYATLGGDNMGSYAPIEGLTVTEIRELGEWLGLPHHLVYKTPIDGLQPLSDEEKLGFTYADLDRYIREDIGTPEFKEKINEIYLRNKFKTDIVQIPHPNFDYLGNFVKYNNLPDIRTPNKCELDLIRIDAEPRYPEDAKVNGIEEDNDNPKMPFLVKDEKSQNGWVWKLDIDIATGEIIAWPKDVKAQTYYKVCDCCRIKYKGKEYYNYVPDFLSIDGEGYGDFLRITIEEGKIKNWSESDCRKFIKDVLMQGKS